MMTRKLGKENAKKVMKALASDEQHFGFIKAKEEDLAELTSVTVLPNMQYRSDVFTFRAGIWMVIVITHKDWVEVTLVNPYDVTDHFTVSDLD